MELSVILCVTISATVAKYILNSTCMHLNHLGSQQAYYLEGVRYMYMFTYHEKSLALGTSVS